MSETVLDASALLAHAKREPGHEKVEDRLIKATVSAVNLSEFAARLRDLGFGEEIVRRMVAALPCRIAAFNEVAAIDAGMLRAATRHLGLSLGDRACLVLARSLGLPAVTADRAWAELDLGVEVVLIR